MSWKTSKKGAHPTMGRLANLTTRLEQLERRAAVRARVWAARARDRQTFVALLAEETAYRAAHPAWQAEATAERQRAEAAYAARVWARSLDAADAADAVLEAQPR